MITVPVIIFGGFCNWSGRSAVLGFWSEKVLACCILFFDMGSG